MKSYLLMLLLFLFFGACRNSENTANETTKKVTVKASLPISENILLNPRSVKIYNKNEIDSMGSLLYGDFDTLLFFRQNNSMVYYYTAKGANFRLYGDWQKKSFVMGLVDMHNKIIIPTEYDLVYNLNLPVENFVVVERNHKFNLFDLEGRKYFEHDIDGIYPVKDNQQAVCQFKSGKIYGWLDSNGVSHYPENEESKSELFVSPVLNGQIKNWKLDENFALRIPKTGYLGEKLYFIPSWFREYGVEDVFIESYDDFQLKIDAFASFEDKCSVFDVLMHEIVDGGAEMATQEKHFLNFIDSTGQILEQIKPQTQFYFNVKNFGWRVVADSLLEVQFSKENDENNVVWEYYRKTKLGKIEVLHSHRRFPFTEFVVMNSKHPFIKYTVLDDSSMSEQEREVAPFLPFKIMEGFTAEDLDYMRNEIFASYGYIFQTHKWQEIFLKTDWYTPTTSNVNDSLTDIEKKNIDYILIAIQKIKKSEE